jgi:hypothetical protein
VIDQLRHISPQSAQILHVDPSVLTAEYGACQASIERHHNFISLLIERPTQ